MLCKCKLKQKVMSIIILVLSAIALIEHGRANKLSAKLENIEKDSVAIYNKLEEEYILVPKEDLLDVVELALKRNPTLDTLEAEFLALMALYGSTKINFTPPPKFLAFLIEIESGFKYNAKSSANAVGIAQVKPKYWKGYKNIAVSDEDFYNPVKNLALAIHILNSYYDMCKNPSLAIDLYSGKAKAHERLKKLLAKKGK